MIENSRTGEQIVFELRTSERLVMHSTWTRPGRRVLEGRAAFRIGDAERTADPRDTVVVPPGTPHLAWNPTDTPVKLRITMRPALRWAEFVERLFAGDDPATLMSQFAREIQLHKL